MSSVPICAQCKVTSFILTANSHAVRSGERTTRTSLL